MNNKDVEIGATTFDMKFLPINVPLCCNDEADLGFPVGEGSTVIRRRRFSAKTKELDPVWGGVPPMGLQ